MRWARGQRDRFTPVTAPPQTRLPTVPPSRSTTSPASNTSRERLDAARLTARTSDGPPLLVLTQADAALASVPRLRADSAGQECCHSTVLLLIYWTHARSPP